MQTAIVPGSFDPVTLGHVDVISRASRIFDRVVVCVVANANKKSFLTLDERREHVSRVTAQLPNEELIRLLQSMIPTYHDAAEVNAATVRAKESTEQTPEGVLVG